jgi:hypothetical protein
VRRCWHCCALRLCGCSVGSSVITQGVCVSVQQAVGSSARSAIGHMSPKEHGAVEHDVYCWQTWCVGDQSLHAVHVLKR